MTFLGICAIMKNEARYIEEWLSFHRAVGVERFILFDNASTDDTRAVIDAWSHRSLVTVIDWPQRPGQNAAYQHMIDHYRDAMQWCAFIDCDEFLCPQSDLSVPDVLRYFSPVCDALYVHWLMFGSSGLVARDARPVTERFTRRGYDSFGPNNIGKSIVRLSAAISVTSCHIIRCAGPMIDDDETEIDQAGVGLHPSTSHRFIALNHYFTKSLQEWRERRSLGKADVPENDPGFLRAEEEFHRHDANDVEDTRAATIMAAARAES